jgi:hypothetical protein
MSSSGVGRAHLQSNGFLKSLLSDGLEKIAN